MANDKLKSRKFIVWFVGTVFQLLALVGAIILKDKTIATDFFSWWGSLSVAYIGGNVAQKVILNKGQNE